MDGNRREVAFIEEVVELPTSVDVLDEDNYLVELKHVQDLVEFLVLLVLLEVEVVLVEAGKDEFVLIINQNLEGLVHELPADFSDFLRQSGREHHHLLLDRGGLEDLLDVGSHI